MRGPGTYIEQLILDLGQAGQGVLETLSLDKGMLYYRHFSKKDLALIQEAMAEHGIDMYANLRERDVNEPFPGDVIEFVSPKLLQEWKDRHTNRDFYHQICLKTRSNPNPRCFGCNTCHTAEEIKNVVHRTIDSTKTIDDVIKVS